MLYCKDKECSTFASSMHRPSYPYRSAASAGSIARLRHNFATETFGNEEARLIANLSKRGFTTSKEIDAYRAGLMDVFVWLEKQ